MQPGSTPFDCTGELPSRADWVSSPGAQFVDQVVTQQPYTLLSESEEFKVIFLQMSFLQKLFRYHSRIREGEVEGK